MRSTIEIILKKDVQSIFDEFSACFKIRVSLLSPTGREIAVSHGRPCHEFCDLIQDSLGNRDKCRDFDLNKRIQALESKDMLTYRCYAGMMETIIPIHFEGIHLGYFVLGHYRNEEKLDLGIIGDWETRVGTSENLIIAYLKTPSFSESQIESIRNFFRVIVDYIVSQNMIVVKSNLIIEKIMNHVRENVHRNIGIEEIAGLVGKSVSTVSHLFSSNLNKSFKQVLIESKLDKAEEALQNQPQKTIKEVAFDFGYDDQYYFSRLFKKYKGYPPSRVQRNLVE